MDQELLHIQWGNDITRARRVIGQPVDSASYAAASGGRMSWPPFWKCDIISNIRLRQSIHTYLMNNPAKFHPDPIWKDGALGFCEEGCGCHNKNNNNKMSGNMDQFVSQ